MMLESTDIFVEEECVLLFTIVTLWFAEKF